MKTILTAALVMLSTQAAFAEKYVCGVNGESAPGQFDRPLANGVYDLTERSTLIYAHNGALVYATKNQSGGVAILVGTTEKYSVALGDGNLTVLMSREFGLSAACAKHPTGPQ